MHDLYNSNIHFTSIFIASLFAWAQTSLKSISYV